MCKSKVYRNNNNNIFDKIWLIIYCFSASLVEIKVIYSLLQIQESLWQSSLEHDSLPHIYSGAARKQNSLKWFSSKALSILPAHH